jgi:putative transposase
LLALRSVTQNFSPSREILEQLETFRRMVNHCIGIGITNDISSLKKLSLRSYRELSSYDCSSRYRLCAISRAAGILAARRKSLKRGFVSKNPYAVKPQLTSCYGFRLEKNGLSIPLPGRKRCDIPLNNHTLSVLSEPGLKVRSFTLTATKLSLCISKEIAEVKCLDTAAVDRNLRNLTYGNEKRVIQHDLSKSVNIGDTTRSILMSFRRNDVRVRRDITSKYGRRRRNRTVQLLHQATKGIVVDALRNREAIVLEDIREIRKLYQKGKSLGRSLRASMNTWAFGEAQRQIEYKARWVGLPVIRLSRRETMGTSRACPRCGERLQSGKNQSRQLWCSICEVWMDRDMVAVINLSRRGRLRFDRSKGGAIEAVKGNPTPAVIPGVDASKLTYQTAS